MLQPDLRERGASDPTTQDRIAAFDWNMEQVKEDHMLLAREMNALLDRQRDFGEWPSADPASAPVSAA